MPDPTFNGADLATEAAHTRVESRRPRAYIETMPGVNGAFVQMAGYGRRDIAIEGLLTAQGASAALARNAVMNAFRQREQLADGATVATFTGTDGCDYPNCILQRYSHGRVRIARTTASVYTAYLAVHAALTQLTP
jgi:hypothetical protein